VVPQTGFVGRVYPAGEPYQVGREKLREFAHSVGAAHPACFDVGAARALGYQDVVAAPTFAVVVAQRAEAAYVDDPAAGIDFTRVVHAEESFHHYRPIVAGDSLRAELRVESVTERRGLWTITTVVHLSDDADQPVSDVTSVLAVRGEDE
jgi:acyl dehydratase